MVNIGMDVHQTSTVFCTYDPRAPEAARYRTLTRPTTDARTIGSTRRNWRSCWHPLNSTC